jgi:hypothetical protein
MKGVGGRVLPHSGCTRDLGKNKSRALALTIHDGQSAPYVASEPNRCSTRPIASTSLADAVVRRQIIDDSLSIGGADRRPVGLDHFVDFAFPALAIEKSRIDP